MERTERQKTIKEPKLPFFGRRFIEAICIMLIASIPIYLLAKTGYLPTNLPFAFTYGILFTVSAVIFLFLSVTSLRRYLIAVDDVKIYFVTNIIILIIQGIFCLVGLKWFSDDLYTALFGYTKPLRLIDMGRWGNVWSAAIFWFVHFMQILSIPVLRARVKKELDEMMATARRMQHDADES